MMVLFEASDMEFYLIAHFQYSICLFPLPNPNNTYFQFNNKPECSYNLINSNSCQMDEYKCHVVIINHVLMGFQSSGALNSGKQGSRIH